MPFSQACKYCIRAVLYMAEHGNSRPLLSRQIAQGLEIPEPFLAKILQHLVRQGLLRSFKGRGGGFMLARPASRISLWEVIKAVEGNHFDKECVLGLSECSAENPCVLHDHWSRAKEELMEVLRRQSAQEVLKKTASRHGNQRRAP